MKKGGTILLLCLTTTFVAFVIGMLVGRNIQSAPVSIELATHPTSAKEQTTNGIIVNAKGLININTASEGILDTLPGIGPVLARRIVEYREEHGPFRDITDLTLVEGIGPEKIITILDLITVED